MFKKNINFYTSRGFIFIPQMLIAEAKLFYFNLEIFQSIFRKEFLKFKLHGQLYTVIF